MHILFLTQIVPYPPDSGPKVKTYHVLRYLADCGHQVTLVSFVREHEKPYIEPLRAHCKEIHPVPINRAKIIDGLAYFESWRSGLPFLVTRDAQSAMQQLIDQLAQQPFDIVHADQLTMAQYAIQFRRACNVRSKTSPAIVFDAHNAVYEIVERARQTAMPFLRPVLGIEAGRLKKYEGSLVEQFDQTLAVSEIDKQALLQVSRSPVHASKISVIPIAVDCAALQPVQISDRPNNILTVSTLFYPPNADGVRWFLREVFPSVQRQIPNVTLNVVGPRPPKDIIVYGAQHVDCVQVTGYVPDLQKYFEQAALMVVPVRAGSGMRVRILEALARGMPIVTTTTGVEGIEAIHEKHLLVADEPGNFADAVVRLLEDRALANQLAQHGRQLAEQKYDWRAVLPRLGLVYKSLDSN